MTLNIHMNKQNLPCIKHLVKTLPVIKIKNILALVILVYIENFRRRNKYTIAVRCIGQHSTSLLRNKHLNNNNKYLPTSEHGKRHPQKTNDLISFKVFRRNNKNIFNQNIFLYANENNIDIICNLQILL